MQRERTELSTASVPQKSDVRQRNVDAVAEGGVMNNRAAQIREPVVTLPSNAPQVRITAGAGTAGQKTWNLRRPVTLIGSRRPAHIVLHDRAISSAHCVIVNTGTEVLVKDLRTSGGTLLNHEPIDIGMLSDGDVFVVGSVKIQVAIQTPESTSDDSANGLAYADPTRMALPVDVRLMHTETHWLIEDAVAMIGRHEKSTVCLDHEDVARRHAIFFRLGKELAIYDLGGKNGVYVNGQCCTITPLVHGDCITVAKFGLAINLLDTEDMEAAPQSNARPEPKSAFSSVMFSGQQDDAEAEDDDDADRRMATQDVLPTTEDEAMVREALDSIDENLADAWTRVNSWESRLERDATALSQQELDLATRAEALDARDATLRGQLFDVTQFNEELKLRERDLSRQAAELQAKRDELNTRESAIEEKETSLQARLAEAQTRENSAAQRWSRLRAAKCANCGTPFRLAAPGGEPTNNGHASG